MHAAVVLSRLRFAIEGDPVISLHFQYFFVATGLSKKEY